MTINSTGTISLSGATTGSSVSIELKRNAHNTLPISMNDVRVRGMLGTVSTNGQISLGSFYSAQEPPHSVTIACSTGSQATQAEYAIGELYPFGGIALSGTDSYQCAWHMEISKPGQQYNTVYVMKLDQNGNKLWHASKTTAPSGFSVSQDTLNSNSSAVDDAGAFYFTHQEQGTHHFLTKLNASGAQQWSKILFRDGTNAKPGLIRNVVIDTNASYKKVWVIGSYTSATYSKTSIWICQVNPTTGVSEGQWGIEEQSNNIYCISATFNPMNNCLILSCTGTPTSGTYDQAWIIPFSIVTKEVSPSTKGYQAETIGGGTKCIRYTGIAVDTQGNMFLSGYCWSGSLTRGAIVTYVDSGLNELWSRIFSNNGLGTSYQCSTGSIDAEGYYNFAYQVGTTNSYQCYVIQVRVNAQGQYNTQYSTSGAYPINTLVIHGVAVDNRGRWRINGSCMGAGSAFGGPHWLAGTWPFRLQPNSGTSTSFISYSVSGVPSRANFNIYNASITISTSTATVPTIGWGLVVTTNIISTNFVTTATAFTVNGTGQLGLWGYAPVKIEG